MGWVIIFVIAILAICVLYGWHTGFMKMLIQLIALAVALIVAAIVAPIVAKGITSSDTLMQAAQDKVYDTLELERLADAQELTVKKLGFLKLPESITEQLTKYAGAEDYKDSFEKLGVENAGEYVARMIALMVIRAVCYIVVFIIALVALLILCRMTDIVFHFIGLESLNKALGAVAGLAEATIIIFVVFAILTACSGTAFGSNALEQISNNAFLSWIYDHNVINVSVVDVSKFVKK